VQEFYDSREDSGLRRVALGRASDVANHGFQPVLADRRLMRARLGITCPMMAFHTLPVFGGGIGFGFVLDDLSDASRRFVRIVALRKCHPDFVPQPLP